MSETPFQLPFDPMRAVEIARTAGREAELMRGRVPVEVKPDDTLVTEADRLTEAFLRQELGKIAPTWSFLGEEGGLVGDVDAPCWVIDPIDGTTNYVRGIPFWCVSVGAVYRGECVFGAIASPPLNEISWAWQNGGAWLQRGEAEPRRLQVFDAPKLTQEDLIACNTTVDRVLNFSRMASRLRNFGSLAMHLAMLSRGGVAACVAHYHKLYDIAAGVCICQEAGAQARYIDGQEWRAEVSGPRETTPLVLAGPETMSVLLRELEMR